MSGPTRDPKPTHFVLISSAGMGHLAPFCRLAATLSTHGCLVTFVAAQPTVSNAEAVHLSDLLASYPSIRLLNLPLAHLPAAQYPPTSDPFYLRVEATRRSTHFLPPLLNSIPDPPVTAAVVDIMLISTFVPVTKSLNLPSYVMFTSSLSMLSLFAHFPDYLDWNSEVGDVEIPGIVTVKKSSLPPPLFDPTHMFRVQFVENGAMIRKTDGVLVNSFEALERMPDLSAALDLPPIYQIGPLATLKKTMCLDRTVMEWLEKQPRRSVVYVSFGSRTAMSDKQVRELALGLERSGERFLWVLKRKKVDKEEDEELGVDEMLDETGYEERVKGRGVVIRGWLEQEDVLGSRAVGLFMSHCGWNSVTEAGKVGMRVMGWPRIGDQRVNAEVVGNCGLGVWMEGWAWEAEGEGGVVGADEIGLKVREMMGDERLRESAERVGVEGGKAVGVGGSSSLSLSLFLEGVSNCK